MPAVNDDVDKRRNTGRKSAVAEKDSEEAYILYTKSRAKEKSHLAKLAEIKEKQTKGELISARVVRLQANKAGREVRDAFSAFPDRVASTLVGLSEREIMAKLRHEIRQTLEAVADAIDGKGEN
jgi:phage terminase Nu1 subunit (DNA packaging protein)